MKLSLIAALVVVVVTASFLNAANKKMPPAVDQPADNQDEVLALETKSAAPATLAPSETPSPTPSDAPKNTTNPTSTSVNSSWQYPNCKIVSEGALMVCESGDSADEITKWYEQKVESMGYSVKSFVKTSANDNIKNVISAAGFGSEIKIKIAKAPEDSVVRIEVDGSSL